MKIAILSDSHDNIPNIEKALNWINQQGISIIIHCGDLCAPLTLTKVILPKFNGQIHLVHGNIDNPELLEKLAKDFSNVKIHGEIGEIKMESRIKNQELRIGFTHRPEKGKELIQSGKYDIVFYGHTHKPWIQKTQTGAKSPCLSASSPPKSALLVNPGTLAGMFYQATFAVYDTEMDKLELKILEKL